MLSAVALYDNGCITVRYREIKTDDDQLNFDLTKTRYELFVTVGRLEGWGEDVQVREYHSESLSELKQQICTDFRIPWYSRIFGNPEFVKIQPYYSYSDELTRKEAELLMLIKKKLIEAVPITSSP